MRVTISAINKSLAAAGIDAEIHRGDGYFYFSGPPVDLAQEQGVYGVTRLSELSVSAWVDQARQKSNLQSESK